MKAEEILVEEGFIDWVLQKETVQAIEWENKMSVIDIDVAELQKAKELVNLLSLPEKRPSLLEIEAEKKRLFESIQINQKGKVRKLYAYVAAAIITFFVIGNGYLFLNDGKSINIRTNFGEIKSYNLPDGSNVVLNSNSEIKYVQNKQSNKREVWINGEAFFRVAKKESKQQFVVHTNQFDIVVTGTQFNASNRNKLSTVLLTEGSITINNKNGSSSNILPNQYYYFGEDEARGKPVKISTNKTEVVTAWLQQKLIFENTSLEEIANIIKETYNITVVFQQNVNSNKMVSGILPNNNIDILLQALSAATNYNFTIDNQTITVSTTK